MAENETIEDVEEKLEEEEDLTPQEDTTEE